MTKLIVGAYLPRHCHGGPRPPMGAAALGLLHFTHVHPPRVHVPSCAQRGG